MFPVECFIWMWVSELICWDDPCLKWNGAEYREMTKVAKGRGGRHFTFIWNRAVISSFLVKGWKAIGSQNDSLTQAVHLELITSTIFFIIKFIWTSSQNKSFSPILLIRLHRGPSLYLSPGMTHSQRARSWTPAPGLCQALQSCVCLKPPDLILHSSCLRSGRSERRQGGRHRGLQVQTVEQM